MIVKTVGRGQDNSIVVSDEKISRTHLQMVQDDSGNVSVVDLGSTNGTYVNGKRIAGETRLKSGDELRIGNTVLPWQSYFSTAPHPSCGHRDRHTDVCDSTLFAKHMKKLVFIICGVLVLLLAGGGLYYFLNKQKSEKERIEVEQKENEQHRLEMENELKAAEKEAARLDDEYNRILEKARNAKSKAERDSLNRIVNAKAKELEEMNKRATDLGEQVGKLKSELTAAKEAQKNTDKELKDAKEAATKAENNLKAEKQKTKVFARELELTNKFHNKLNEIKDNKESLKKVCDDLGISNYKNNKDDMYKKIDEAFKNAQNNDRREYIVNVLEGKVKTANHTKSSSSKAVEEPVAPTNEPVRETNDMNKE